MTDITIVAEIGSNFIPGNLDSALEMIRVASACGADLAKFQAYNMDYIDRPEWWKVKCKGWELPAEKCAWYSDLVHEALRHNIDCFFSVFDIYSLKNFVTSVGLPIIKVAASEIGNQSLLRAINRLKAPEFRFSGWSPAARVYLSVDYRKHGQVVPALTWLPDCEVTLLHTVSEYPAEEARMDALMALKQYGLPIGYSNHVPYPACIRAVEKAVALGASVVEMHLRTEDTPKEAPDCGPWSLLPEHFSEATEVIRNA